MKNVSKFKNPLLFISTLLAVVLFSSCESKKYPQYTLASKTIIPESDKQKYADFIVKAVSSASYHMTTCDYEDP